ncbi:hypothetical protein M427DRAFT_494913 [Gonapodya prolifera JEL478]|uniref:Uncharacterized protein n=1 Tax=Gonapodya prolifera (strain JEL478) TaxID=1344416 RepID=A0A139AHW1_GONPJ|nr:hypothetical protein M427DRAFT_494913 [Gonapodya prolifera JEL478]|eukprot:KXS16411.1 hypothetical protein M427DRAFT_494913 [Gonapodya prolifera JEL478]
MKDLRVKCAVMERKKVELNGAFESQERVLATHARSIRQLQQTLVRINTLISQQAVQQSRLEEANLGLENEYRGRLRDAEDEAVRLEEAYERLVTEKEKAEEGFLDLERQILLWEKKIQIVKETADALDPNVGSADLVAMRAEIHRMKLRLSSLLKLQEKMIQEMEKCILRRETIGTKAGGGVAMMIGLEAEKGRRGLAGQQQLRKAIEDLTRKLRTLVQDVKEAERELQSVSSTTSRLASIISETNASITHVTDRTIHVQSEIISKANVKVSMATEVLLFQKGGKRYQELKDGKYVPVVKEEAKRPEEWEAWKEKLRTIEAVLVKAEVSRGSWAIQISLGYLRPAALLRRCAV